MTGERRHLAGFSTEIRQSILPVYHQSTVEGSTYRVKSNHLLNTLRASSVNTQLTYCQLEMWRHVSTQGVIINPLNAELNPICYLLALLLAHHFFHVSRKRVKSLTLRRLMSYIYMEHPFLMFLDHTQRRSTVGRTPLDE